MSRHVEMPGPEFLHVDHGVAGHRVGTVLLGLVGQRQGVQEVGHDVPSRHGLLGAEGPVGRPDRDGLARLEHGELVDRQHRVAALMLVLLLRGRRGRGRARRRRRRRRAAAATGSRGCQVRRVKLSRTVLQEEAAVLALEVHLHRSDRTCE